MFKPFYLALVLIVGSVSWGFSQERELDKKDQWLPKLPLEYNVDLANVCVGQVDVEASTIRLSKPLLKPQRKTAKVNQTVFKTETRVRLIKGKDGRDEAVTYTVQVPVTMENIKEYTVLAAAGALEINVPIDQIRAWDIAGKALDAKELVVRMKKSTRVLATVNASGSPYSGVDPYFASILKDGTIVIFLPEDAWTKYREEDSDKPQIPATK